MRYRLRTLLIVLAIGPALLAGAWLMFGMAGGLLTMLLLAYIGGSFWLAFALR